MAITNEHGARKTALMLSHENKKRYVYKNGKRIEKIVANENTTVLSKNPIVRWFSKKKIDIAIKCAKLQPDDVILDFGCGGGYLERVLNGYDIVGYDVTPHHTQIKDYTTISPTKIFVLDVFEHIPKKEIIRVVKNFKKMSKSFHVITAIPTENWFSRKSRLLMGKPERVRDHITSIDEITKILGSEFQLVWRKNFMSTSIILKYRHATPD